MSAATRILIFDEQEVMRDPHPFLRGLLEELERWSTVETWETLPEAIPARRVDAVLLPMRSVTEERIGRLRQWSPGTLAVGWWGGGRADSDALRLGLDDVIPLGVGALETRLAPMAAARQRRAKATGAGVERCALLVHPTDDIWERISQGTLAAGFQVRHAHTPHDALAALRQHEIQLVILHPDMASTTFVKAARLYDTRIGIVGVLPDRAPAQAIKDRRLASVGRWISGDWSRAVLAKSLERAFVGWAGGGQEQLGSLVVHVPDEELAERLPVPQTDDPESASFLIVYGLEGLLELSPEHMALPIITVLEDASDARRCIALGAADVLFDQELDREYLAARLQAIAASHHERRAWQASAVSLTQELEGRQQLVDRAGEAILVLDRDGIVRFANPAAEQMLGRSRDELVGLPFGNRHKDGAEVEVPGDESGPRVAEMRVRPLQWAGDPASTLVTLRDVTHHRETVSELEQTASQLGTMARTDPDTGVLNRAGIDERLHVDAARARQTGSGYAAVYLDISAYSNSDNTLSIELVRRVADLLKARLMDGDLVGRVSPHGFLVLLHDIRTAEAMRVGERLRIAVANSAMGLAESRGSGPAGPEVGVLPASSRPASVSDVLRRLNPMTARAGNAQGRVMLVRGDQSASVWEADTLTDVTHGGGASMRVVSQAIHRLKDDATFAREFLVRGAAGQVSLPGDLVSLCIESKLLNYVDMMCFRKCVAAAREFDVPRHINLFPSTLSDTSLRDILKVLGTGDHGAWCLEIDEQMIVGSPIGLRSRAQKLSQEGVLLAVDAGNFGRGSLEAVVALSPDYVKIDIGQVAGDEFPETTVARFVGVCAAAGAQIIAKGVETQAQLDLVRSFGIPLAQGYLWGRPE